jgi:oxygen-independent coproporphyrinogen-3 oxidase
MEPMKNGKLPVLDDHEVTLPEKMEEEMFLGLRKTDGVGIRHFTDKFGYNPSELFRKELSDLTARKLIEIHNGRIMLTKNGRLLGNEVFQSFLGVSNH